MTLTEPLVNLDTFFENLDFLSFTAAYLTILRMGECSGEPDLLISLALILVKSFDDIFIVSTSVTVITGITFSYSFNSLVI